MSRQRSSERGLGSGPVSRRARGWHVTSGHSPLPFPRKSRPGAHQQAGRSSTGLAKSWVRARPWNEPLPLVSRSLPGPAPAVTRKPGSDLFFQKGLEASAFLSLSPSWAVGFVPRKQGARRSRQAGGGVGGPRWMDLLGASVIFKYQPFSLSARSCAPSKKRPPRHRHFPDSFPLAGTSRPPLRHS